MQKKTKRLWKLFFENQNYEKNQAVDVRFDYIKKFVRGEKVLDFGFGTGYFIKKFSSVGYDSYGFDISRGNDKQIVRKFSIIGIKVFFADITKLPFNNDFFDTITASEVFEHLTEKELNTALNEIFRILKKDGRLIITVPFEEKLDENMVICPFCLRKFHTFLHRQTFDREKIKKIALKHGCKNVEFGTFLTFIDFFRRVPFPIRRMFSQFAIKLRITEPYYILAVLEK